MPNLNTGLTLPALVSMTPGDFEQFRADGWSSRQVLTQAVAGSCFCRRAGWLHLKFSVSMVEYGQFVCGIYHRIVGTSSC